VLFRSVNASKVYSIKERFRNGIAGLFRQTRSIFQATKRNWIKTNKKQDGMKESSLDKDELKDRRRLLLSWMLGFGWEAWAQLSVRKWPGQLKKLDRNRCRLSCLQHPAGRACKKVCSV